MGRAVVVRALEGGGDLDRFIAEHGLAAAGDVLLVANAGAYGRSMASSYNLRQPPEEIVLPA